MIKSGWRTASKLAIEAGALAILLLGSVSAVALLAENNGKLVAKFSIAGEGVVFHTVYELRTRALETSRYYPGAGLRERRRLVLSGDSYERFESILKSGGYLTEPQDSLERPEVDALLGALVDDSHWIVRVYRKRSKPVIVRIPSPFLGKYHPDLKEIPYVTSGWKLLEEFGESWGKSEVVLP